MPRSMKNDNFIDKSFTVMADMILKFMPGVSQSQKTAFAYYREGMTAQSDGDYAEAMQNYEEALTLEDNPVDRGYIYYNMGLIHQSNGQLDEALECYEEAVSLNPQNSSPLNNIAVIWHYRGDQAKEAGDDAQAEACFDQAAQYWVRAIRIAPSNYIEAQNWLKNTGRSNIDLY